MLSRSLTLLLLFVGTAMPQNLPPQIVDHSKPILNIQNGASTMVFCTIRYLGNYEVTFQRLTTGTTGNIEPMPITQGKVVFSPDHLDKYQIRHDDQSETWELTINKLTEEDEGNYECAVQTRPPTRQQFLISVEEPPIIENHLTSKDSGVKEFSKLDLKCSARGDPEPTITWTRHGDAPLPIGGRSWVGSKMHIHRVLREDRGTYRCEARNSAGVIHRDIRVEVQFAPSIEAFRPIIVEHVENAYRRQQGYTEIEGSYAELDCDVIASPRLSGDGVYWYVLDPRTQGRNRIQPEKMKNKYSIQTIAQANNEVISKLTIRNFLDTDFATYVCEASNTEGIKEETIPLREYRDAEFITISGNEVQWSSSASETTLSTTIALLLTTAVALIL